MATESADRATATNVVYTVAIDDPGQFLYRNLAKVLASSIVRSGFEGETIVFHNSPELLFQFPRAGITEVPVSMELPSREGTRKEDLVQRWALKHSLGSVLLDYQWDNALFIDADCVVTGPLEEIFSSNREVSVYREAGQHIGLPQFNCFLSDEEIETLTVDGINSGVFCVSRGKAKLLFDLWGAAETRPATRRRCCDDQAALNRVLLDQGFQISDISRLVSMPFHAARHSGGAAKKASIIHMVGAVGGDKLRASFGTFMETYFFDPALTLFNLLES